jgi:glycosyltransferase involved in cell wall biosynthesis
MLAEGFPPETVGVIYNGIDPGPLSTPQHREAARRQLGLSPEARVIGTVARLDPVKNLTFLVDAFAEIAADDDLLNLVIVGEGPERHRLARLVEERGLVSRVCLAGHRESPRELLPAFDIYANTSSTEGVSVTILEAMAAGLPVVATAVGGTPEVVIEGETGLLVPSHRVDDLGAAMERLKGDPLLRDRLARAGRERVEAVFSLDRMVTEYKQLYARPG